MKNSGRRKLRLRALHAVIERCPNPTCGRFQIEITANELAAHLDARARWYEAAAERAGERVFHWLPYGPMRARDAAQRRANDYGFLLKHIVLGATYLVNANELEYLELVMPSSSLLRLIARELR